MRKPQNFHIWNDADASQFGRTGGVLGFWCEHQYAHASNDANKRFPYTLKGVDVAIYSIFSSFGLAVETRPIMDVTDYGYNRGKKKIYVGKKYYQLHLSRD